MKDFIRYIVFVLIGISIAKFLEVFLNWWLFGGNLIKMALMDPFYYVVIPWIIPILIASIIGGFILSKVNWPILLVAIPPVYYSIKELFNILYVYSGGVLGEFGSGIFPQTTEIVYLCLIEPLLLGIPAGFIAYILYRIFGGDKK